MLAWYVVGMLNVIDLDDLVNRAIHSLFRNPVSPDESNYLPNGQQHKDPDHAVLDGKVLIERKSRTAIDDGAMYAKLSAIAAEQGRPFRAYGRISASRIIMGLPDPEKADREMADYVFGQFFKRVKDARRQFEEYRNFETFPPILRILILTVESNYRYSSSLYERNLGRKMGGYGDADETGLIDCIYVVLNPSQLMVEPRSYWFKCLMKSRLTEDQRVLANGIARRIHDWILSQRKFDEVSLRALAGTFSPLRC